MTDGPPRAAPSRRDVAVAGHTGDTVIARAGLRSNEASVRATALGALDRLGHLSAADLDAAASDESPHVRTRVAQLAARCPDFDLLPLLSDRDPHVVEMAAWAAGEHEADRAGVVAALCGLAEDAADPLVREAAVAALGAIGSEAGRAVILAALDDKPAIRRRAVLALAPFAGPDVDAAIERAGADRDWQVRQAAEDLRRAMR